MAQKIIDFLLTAWRYVFVCGNILLAIYVGFIDKVANFKTVDFFYNFHDL